MIMKKQLFFILFGIIVLGFTSCSQEKESKKEVPLAPKQYRRPENLQLTNYKYSLKDLQNNFSEDMMQQAASRMEAVKEVNSKGKWKPTKESINKHVTPEWFEDLKFGMFMDKPAAPWIVARDKFLEKHRMRRLRLVSVDVDKQIAAGKSLTVTASLIALDDVAEGTTKVQMIRDGAIIASTDILSPATKAGAATAIGPVELAIPAMAWGGRHEIVIRRNRTRIEGHDDGQVAEVNVIARKPRSTNYSVKLRNGTPQIFEDNTPLPPPYYMYERPNPDQVKRFAQAGTHLYWLECRQMGWVGPDEHDYTFIDEMLTELFTLAPEARVVLWFYIDLTNPIVDPIDDPWWQQQNPGELCRDADGNTFDYYGHQAVSFASTKMREDATAAMKRFIARMEASSFANRIAGYQPCAGGSYEWMYYGAHDSVFLDYSEPTVSAFRDWLRDRYDGRQEDLRAAWASGTVTFENANVPTPTKRQDTTLGSLRDPQTERPVIDYYTFFAELTAGTVDHYCSVIKEATCGTKLAGAFYGYVMEQSFDWAGAQHSGHHALGRALESDAIDFLMGPTSYWDREPGGAGGHMSALGSIRLHQKLWINQSDLRTHLTSTKAGFGRSANEKQSLGAMRREFAMDLAAGAPVYWYCFSNPWLGPSETLMKGIERMGEIDAEASELERGLDGNGIAVIVSDDIAAYTGLAREPLRSLVYLQRELLNSSGVRFDVFLDSDLDHPDMPRYRAYLFLGAISMDAERRAWIDANLKSDGRVLAFVWAQGIIGDTLALSNAEKLCGIDLGMDKTPGVITVQPKPGLGPKYGSDEAFGPVLYSDDETAEVLGSLTSPAAVAGKVGLCVKRFPDWISVYSAAPKLSPEVIRSIAQLAGVHVFSESNDPIYVGRRYLGIHAKAAGKRSIKLPSRSTVVDCFSQREIGKDIEQFDIELDDFETKIYRIK